MYKPLVTVAIPTYKRPKLLKRALDCLIDQDYENFEVIISDNGTEGDAVENVITEYKDRFPKFKFYKQQQNIGAFKNFFFLLDRAEGEYFMWFADDDEITIGYISYLAEMLTQNPDAASVSANWFLMRDEQSGQMMPRKEYANNCWFFRVVKFIWCGKDDFFYGMHRKNLLQNATFNGYCWPNKTELINWAYVFLLDQVIAGTVLVAADKSIRFINHDYGIKNYTHNKPNVLSVLQRLFRRLNVYGLYFIKILNKKSLVFSIPIFLLITLSALVELVFFFKRVTIKLFKDFSRKLKL